MFTAIVSHTHYYTYLDAPFPLLHTVLFSLYSYTHRENQSVYKRTTHSMKQNDREEYAGIRNRMIGYEMND